MGSNVEKIKNRIDNFCSERLSQEYKEISFNILQGILFSNKDMLDSSRPDIWTSAILNIVLEQNLLYNRKHPLYMTKKDFSKQLGVSQNTVKNKSQKIKDILKIEPLDQSLVAKSNLGFWIEGNGIDKEEVRKENNKLLYKKYMGLAHGDINHENKVKYFKEAIKVSKDIIEEKTNIIFWENVSTRAYMIAIQDIGMELYENGKLKEAREAFEYLININPTDDQGIRYTLINILIILNDRKAINKLFEKYSEEKSSTWLYSKSLYYFKNKNIFMATDTIKAAIKQNKYIALYLIEWTNVLSYSNVYVNPEIITEAAYYYKDNIMVWKEVKGSINWLLKEVMQTK